MTDFIKARQQLKHTGAIFAENQRNKSRELNHQPDYRSFLEHPNVLNPTQERESIDKMKIMFRYGQKLINGHIPTNVQYFLASLCDAMWSDKIYDCIRAKSQFSTDVRGIVTNLHNNLVVNGVLFEPNTNIAVLKELLAEFPSGIFCDISEDLFALFYGTFTLQDLRRVLSRLPSIVRVFSYLVFASLQNIVDMPSAKSRETRAELLIHFTPVIFPQTLGDIDRFLWGSRLILLMVDYSHELFQLDENQNEVIEDDTLLSTEILESLYSLEQLLEVGNMPVDNGVTDTDTDYEYLQLTDVLDKAEREQRGFYQFTFDN